MFAIPRPTVATSTPQPFWQSGWLYERDLNGHRCLAVRDAEGTRLYSRTGRETTTVFPEIVDALQQQTATSFVIDGEIVAFEGNRPSFALLKPRIRRLYPEPPPATTVPVFFYVFDVLELGEENLRSAPLADRKASLRGLLTWEDPVRWTPHDVGVGEDWFVEACARGWQGVIAKRVEAPYVPGPTADWRAFRCDVAQA